MTELNSGNVLFELILLRNYICQSLDWNMDEVKIEVTLTNLKTGEKESRSLTPEEKEEKVWNL